MCTKQPRDKIYDRKHYCYADLTGVSRIKDKMHNREHMSPTLTPMALRCCLIVLYFAGIACANAGWFDAIQEKAEDLKKEIEDKGLESTSVTLGNDEITDGLKEALVKAADYAVNNLGQAGGFLNNVKVHIPMPEKLSNVETLLRKTGQDKYADEFVTTMNSAAEAAVKSTLGIFKKSIKNLSISDAKKILNGPDNAATQYLRETNGKELSGQISPIVKKATNDTGVTRLYKSLYEKTGFMGKYMKPEDYDIDAYVVNKTLDGIFVMIAEEEKKIRDDPLERTSDILKNVFGLQDKHD